MSSPFFSIIIPTRNRPELFELTLSSVLGQDFVDYEVIVSDNSADDNTYEFYHSLRVPDKVSYIRPSQELNMPDHWEFATLKASGHYVLVLTDRSVLMAGALSTIYTSLAQTNPNVDLCSWGWGVFDDASRLVSFPKFTRDIIFRKSDDVFAEFVGPQFDYPYVLPRGLNSCYSAKLASAVRERFGRLFFSINPDYHSAFLLLSLAEGTLYFDNALFLSHGLGVSNGGSGYLTDASPYLSSLGDKDWFELVPLKSALIENIIYVDYLDVSRLMSDSRPWDFAEYFLRTYKELLEKKAAGVICPDKLNRFFHEWEEALNVQDESIRARVFAGVRDLEKSRLLSNSFFRRSFSWLRRRFAKGRASRKFSSVMRAAGFNEVSGR